MVSCWRALVGVVLLVALSALPGFSPAASAAPHTVTVVVHDLAPFVTTDDGLHSGFTIDLWEEIAKRNQWTTNYVDVDSVGEQLRLVADGRGDVGAGAISITADRLETFDFSQPIINAGLQILVPAHAAEPSSPGLPDFLRLLFSNSMLVWLLAALALTVIPAHIAWLIERRSDDPAVSKSYLPGIFQAFAWGLGALAAQPEGALRHWLSRSIAILWAFVSIIFVAYYTATLTSTMTVEKFEAKIAGPSDLFEKRVATVAGTTSANFLRSVGVRATTLPTIEDCLGLLRDEGYDAVVFDAPVLRYLVTHDDADFARIAGPVFQTEDYGLAFRTGDPLRKEFDQALLSIREDGTYDIIKQKWFGDDESSSAGDGN